MLKRIDSVAARDRLATRRAPYWQRLSKGCFLGYRKMTTTSPGVWQVRYRKEDGDQAIASLGTLEDIRPHERFDRAVVEARKLIEQILHTGTVHQDVITVRDACDAYVKTVRGLKGNKEANELASRYHRRIHNDPIQSIELNKLTRNAIAAYRERLVNTPVRVNRAGDTRMRSKDTVNRDLAALRVALNNAFRQGHVHSDTAWREGLKAYTNVARRRGLYLDRDQRRMLLQCAPDELALFLKALSILPLRPGAVAALRVQDFEQRLSVLNLGPDKRAHDRRIKLPPETAAVFLESCAGKPLSAPLFSRADGSAWNKDSWYTPIKETARRAGLPDATCAYTLRHSVITDLVHGGLDLLTVAQLSGTSVAMIEKHYGHLRSDVAAQALARLAL